MVGVVLVVVVGMLCFTALGVGVSTLVPNADAAGPVVSLVFFILVALSGLYFPVKPGSGLATFTVGSALCSVAPGLGWLIAFRMLQAVGGSMLNPVAMSIITNTFTDKTERARAIGPGPSKPSPRAGG